jgi:DNA-binding beta-propeller fold protein YncE
VALAVAAFAPLAKAQAPLPLKLVATTPMPGFDGDFDHFAADVKGGHVYLAAENKKTVEIFDMKTGARAGAIEGFGHPLVLHYLASSNQLLVTDGGFPEGAPGALQVVDCSTNKIVKTVTLRPGVDHGAYDAVHGRYYVESASETAGASGHVINAIDTKTFTVVGQTEVPGESNEGEIVDKAGKKLYLNLTGTDEVGVIDLATLKLVQRWPLPAGAKTAHAITLDEKNHRVFTVSRKPGLFIVMDSDNGKIIAQMPCCGVNSDISRDVARKRIYITGTDTISVFTQVDADHYEHLAEVPSAYRAKSSIFIPKMSRLFVAASGKNGPPGAELKVLVFDAQ